MIASTLSLALLASTPALAGCTKDTDCKGTRICEAQVCVDPPTAPSAPAPAAPVAAAPAPRPFPTLTELQRAALESARRKGNTAYWGAGGAAVGGLTALAVYSDASNIIGGMALVSGITGSAVGAGGGKQARDIGRSLGISPPPSATRTWGYIGITLGSLTGLGLIVAGMDGAYISEGMIVSTTMLVAASTVAFGVDAHVAANHVEERVEARQLSVRQRGWVQPYVHVGGQEAYVGLHGRF